MTEAQVRQRVGLGYVLANVLVVLLVTAMLVRGSFDLATWGAALAALVPVTGTHAVLIWKWNADHPAAAAVAGPQVSSTFVVFAFLGPFLLLAFAAGAVWLFARKQAIVTVDQFVMAIGTVETLFGAFAGYYLAKLFK